MVLESGSRMAVKPGRVFCNPTRPKSQPKPATFGGSSTVILDYASSLLANALNRHYYFVLLEAPKNIDG